MATRLSLKVEKRKILGKKVKKLRKDGVFPANVYGKDIKSQAVQASLSNFLAVYKESGETGLVDLDFEGKKIPVLIHNLQVGHRHEPLHVDFYKVNLKEKVKATVPIELVGEPEAVSEKLGILMQILNEVEVEALPEELPEKIEVDVQQLSAVNDQLTIADLKKNPKVEILTDTSQVIAKIGELVSKEAQELAAEEAAAAEEASAEAAETSEEKPESEDKNSAAETSEEKPESEN